MLLLLFWVLIKLNILFIFTTPINLRMIRTRSKKVLLVAPEVFPGQLLAGYDNVRHVSATTTIFPNIHALKPDVIFFDHAHMGNNLEKTLRRLQTNAFYKSIKICLYKKEESINADSLFKVLGVDHIIYSSDLQKTSKSSTALAAINNMIDASLIKLVAGAN